MSEQHDDAAALKAAEGLTGALEAMTGEIRNLTAYGHRNRRMIWGLIVSITLDLVLTVVVAVFAIQAHNADTSASAAKAAAAVAGQDSQALCQAGNVARAQQVGLWDYLFQLAGPPPTPQSAKLDDEFKRHLQIVFAPRNCNHLGGK